MAPPPDEYATPSGGAGRLKLKGSSKPQDGNRVDKNKDKDKKKKKKKKERKKDKDDEDRDGSPSFARPQDHDGRGGGDGDDGDRDRDRGSREASEAAGDGETVLADKTEAEKRYEGTRKRRLNERLKRDGVKSHKERVEELNQYLSNLSEHHDMPKIGPG